jgi:L-amino acid N-acyltransferase YncA
MYELIFDKESQNELKKWIESRTGSNYQQDVYLGIAKDGMITACCAYEVYGNAAFAHIATEAQIPKCFLNVIFDYPFNQLKLSRIIALIKNDNQKAIKLVKYMGFKLIDTREVEVYEMTKADCKWLNAVRRKE